MSLQQIPFANKLTTAFWAPSVHQFSMTSTAMEQFKPQYSSPGPATAGSPKNMERLMEKIGNLMGAYRKSL